MTERQIFIGDAPQTHPVERDISGFANIPGLIYRYNL